MRQNSAIGVVAVYIIGIVVLLGVGVAIAAWL